MSAVLWLLAAPVRALFAVLDFFDDGQSVREKVALWWERRVRMWWRGEQ